MILEYLIIRFGYLFFDLLLFETLTIVSDARQNERIFEVVTFFTRKSFLLFISRLLTKARLQLKCLLP